MLTGAYGLFLAARAVAGAAQGLFIAAGIAVAVSLVPAERTGRSRSVVISGFAVSSAVGVPLGTLVGRWLGWRGSFVAVILLAAVTLVATLVVVPSLRGISDRIWQQADNSYRIAQLIKETIMNDRSPNPALPPVVDRKNWQEAREKLLAREKAHTREGDAIAATRRRLPMVEVDAAIEVIGPDGPTTILDVFEGRSQLIAYFHAWWPGRPAAEQCQGCTFFNSQVRELSYLHSRDVTYAVLCKGPYDQSVRYRDFLGLEMPWYSAEKTAPQLLEGRDWQVHHLVCYVRDGERVFETYSTGGRGVEIMAPTHGLLDLTVYGRQEAWEDSPDGWPQPWYSDERPEEFRINGRPIVQWARIEAGYSDELTDHDHQRSAPDDPSVETQPCSCA